MGAQAKSPTCCRLDAEMAEESGKFSKKSPAAPRFFQIFLKNRTSRDSPLADSGLGVGREVAPCHSFVVSGMYLSQGGILEAG